MFKKIKKGINLIYFTEKEQAIFIICGILMLLIIFYGLINLYYKNLKKCPKCGNKLIFKERINMIGTVKYKYCFRCGWSKEIH